MKRSRQEGKGTAGAVALVAVIAGAYWYIHNDTKGVKSTPKEPQHQLSFESIRTSKADEYHNAKNEIVQDKIFNTANSEQDQYWQSSGYKIESWKAKVDSIQTSHNGAAADIELTSPQGVTYKQNNIPSTSAIFKQASLLKEGDEIYFSGEFSKILKGSAGSLFQEGSISQYGSLYNPTYGVHLSQIYAVNSQPPVAELYAPSVSSSTDTFDQSNTQLASNQQDQQRSPDIDKKKQVEMWACPDKLVTAELSDALKHSPDLAERLSIENNCLEISTAKKIIPVGHEQFVVPAGKQSVAIIEAYLNADDGSDYRLPGYFYVMEKDLSSYSKQAK